MNEYHIDRAEPDTSGQLPPEVPDAWLSVPKVAHIFLVAGMPRNKRTIRRYCERGDLDCRKSENALHQPQYFIDPQSVETYIAQQRSLPASDPAMSGLSRTEPVTAGHDHIDPATSSRADKHAGASGQSRTEPDMSGQGRAPASDALIEQLSERLREKDGEIAFLRGELTHRRTTDTALHDVIAAFRMNAEAQRLAAGASPERREQGASQIIHNAGDESQRDV